MTHAEKDLTVAVTGPTGTFGSGLIPLLEADDRIARIIGIARRPFDPAALGWTKMEYRRGDVRDPDALRETFRDADVVVHLAFLITGTASRGTTKAVNVDGTLNVFRAAGDAGVRRFVYAPSVAAYGFALPVPVPMLTMQLIHEEDVGQALLLCVVGAGPPGAYNIAGEGIVTTADIARELGAIPIPLPEASARAVARAVAAFPFLPAALEWVEAAGRPAIMDTTKARTELGWKPVYTSLEALRDTLRARPE